MLTIEIFNSGSAFDQDANAEAARILRDFADRLQAGNPPEVLRDMNGNRAGTASLSPMDEWTEEDPDPYTAAGYQDRADYLASLAKQFNREPEAVTETAALLGQAEDFGLLPITLRDFEEQRTN
jgi:hypothetical protein